MRLSRIRVPLVELKSDFGLDGMEEGLLHNYSLCCQPSRPILLRNKIPLLILPEGLLRINLQYVYIIQLRLMIHMFLIYK